MSVKQEPTTKKEPFTVPIIEPDSSEDRADPGTDDSNDKNGSATNKLNQKKARIFNNEGYDDLGENPSTEERDI